MFGEDEDPQRGTKAPPSRGLPGFPAYLFIYVEDVDTVIARAVELGATLQRPAQDQFYGDRDGYIIDSRRRIIPFRRREQGRELIASLVNALRWRRATVGGLRNNLSSDVASWFGSVACGPSGPSSRVGACGRCG